VQSGNYEAAITVFVNKQEINLSLPGDFDRQSFFHFPAVRYEIRRAAVQVKRSLALAAMAMNQELQPPPPVERHIIRDDLISRLDYKESWRDNPFRPIGQKSSPEANTGKRYGFKGIPRYGERSAADPPQESRQSQPNPPRAVPHPLVPAPAAPPAKAILFFCCFGEKLL
jgi:hypothetical protein